MRDVVTEKVFRQVVRSKTQDAAREQVVVGPPGVAAAAGTHHHVQASPSSNWIINHNLGRKPAVELFLTGDLDSPVWTDIEYPDELTVVIQFPDPATGHAYM